MSTPRDDEKLRAEEETRIDPPRPKGAPPDDAPMESRPSAFPSVGGRTNERDQIRDVAPFAPVRDESMAAVAVSADTSRPVLAAPVGGRTGRWRWVAASVATLAILALVAGIVFLGARPGTPSLVAQFAPADAAIYTELRLDLPGDQRDRLVSFMSNFPGFADPATFQQKIDDTLANALRSTGAGFDWRADIEPWFGGEIGMFSSSLAPTQGTPPSMTIVLTVKDRGKFDELVYSKLTGPGLEMKSEDYKGQQVWSGNSPDAGRRFTWAVTDEALVISLRNEDLKAALDIKAGEIPGLADDAFFVGQLGQMHADRLALVYYDYSGILETVPAGASLLPAGCLDDLQAGADTRLLAEVRAESDHLAVNMRSQVPTGGNLPPAPANKRSALAESIPSATLAYIEMREVGAGIKYLVGELISCVTSGIPGGFDVRQLEQLIGTAPEDYFDFLDDAAFALTFTDGKVGGGIVASVDDENVARTRIDRLLGAVGLVGGVSGLTTAEQQHGAATITVISFDGGPMPAGEVPSISISVTGGRLYLGVGDFVTGALDRAAADSLATTPRLQQALSAAGAENAGIVYVDIGAIRQAFESTIPGDGQVTYDNEIKPFLAPITHFIVVSRNEGGINASHAFLYVE